MSSSQGRTIPSPLRKIAKEPFDERIRKILQKNVSNPLIKYDFLNLYVCVFFYIKKSGFGNIRAKVRMFLLCR